MDKRSPLEKKMWDIIGPPLYYCEDCLLAVEVVDGEIKRPCDCTGQVIAPRKAVVAGEGGLNFTDKAKLLISQIGATLTGRCV